MQRNEISIPAAICFRMFRRQTFRNVSQLGFGEKTEALKPENTGRNQNAKTQPRDRLETKIKI